jgi:hypothetical protein
MYRKICDVKVGGTRWNKVSDFPIISQYLPFSAREIDMWGTERLDWG